MKGSEPRQRQVEQVPTTRAAASRTQATPAANRVVRAEPPRTGCWVCKGSHWLKDCPTATEVQKEEAQAKMRDLRSSRSDRMRRVAVDDTTSPRALVAFVNDLIELPLCVDSGADVNVIPVNAVEKLRASGVDCTQDLAVPVKVELADGRHVPCSSEAVVD